MIASAPPAHGLAFGSTWSTSPQPPREPSSARIDAALTLDVLPQGLGNRLVRRRVAHDPGPLAPGPLVGLHRVGGAPDDGGHCRWVATAAGLGAMSSLKHLLSAPTGRAASSGRSPIARD
jgi:hypothetical protein